MELYHSIAFRERCLTTQKFLQRKVEKVTTAKTTTSQDPLNDPEVEDQLIYKGNNDVQLEINVNETKDLPQGDTTIEVQRPINQHQRILRNRSHNAYLSMEKISYSPGSTPVEVSSKTESSPISDPTPRLKPSSLKTSPRFGRRKCKKSSSATTEEFNISSATNDAGLPETDVVKSSLPSSPHKKTPERTMPEEPISSSESEKKDKSVVKPGDPKIYICDLCGHQSTNPRNLDIHILRHKGEKNFECTDCGAKHYSKYLLQLHIRVKHQGEKPFVCRYCGQSFYSGSTRVRHEK